MKINFFYQILSFSVVSSTYSVTALSPSLWTLQEAEREAEDGLQAWIHECGLWYRLRSGRTHDSRRSRSGLRGLAGRVSDGLRHGQVQTGPEQLRFGLQGRRLPAAHQCVRKHYSNIPITNTAHVFLFMVLVNANNPGS